MGQIEIGRVTVSALAGVGCVILLAIVGREIYFAVNPGKRPRKHKRRRSE